MAVVNQSTSACLNEPFSLGGCDVDPATGQVRNGEQTVKLQPQAIEVLKYLARRPGEVISRHEIEDAVWNDRIVGYDALTGTMFKLRKALGDDPKAPRVIETISKRGYRLLVSPQPISDTVDAGHERSRVGLSAHSGGATSIRTRLIWGASALLGLLAVGVVWMFENGADHDSSGLTEKKSAIVILPFESLASERKQDYLADGLTEDLTTALAKVAQLTVIARDSAFVYKGDKSDFREIAERLKVDLILRGSVRQQGGRVRVNAQLVDIAKGSHVWAERFDGSTRQIFDLQDQIVEKVVGALTDHATPTNIQKSLVIRTKNTEAYRAFQLGRQHFYLYLSKQENAKARVFFMQALRYDPNFAMAHAMLAWTHAFDAMNGWAANRDVSLQLAHDRALKAVSLNKELPLSYFVTGLVFREQGEYVKALVEAEKAISYDPNYANAHVLLATLLYYAGRPKESVARLKRAMRLNPHHPFNYSFHLGQAYFTLRRYDDAIKALETGIKSNPASERLHVWLAASFAHAGKLDDAQWEAEQVRVLNPKFSLAVIGKSFPFKSSADLDHFIEGLRKAGLT